MLVSRQTWIGFVLIFAVVVYELYCPEEGRAQLVSWLAGQWTARTKEAPGQDEKIAVG